MQLEIFLYALLVVGSIILVILLERNMKLAFDNKKLKTQLSGKLTDFERLELIVKLYRSVDFRNINQDQKKIWDDVLFKEFCKFKAKKNE